MKTRAKNEVDFLRQEAETAQTAIQHTLGRLEEGVKTAVPLTSLVRQHPKAAAGISGAAGFAFGYLAMPSRRHASEAGEEDGRPSKKNGKLSRMGRAFGRIARTTILGAASRAFGG